MLAKKENVDSLEVSVDYMNYKVKYVTGHYWQWTHSDWFLPRGPRRYGSHQRVARTQPPRERGGHSPGPHERGCIHKAPKGEGHPQGPQGRGEFTRSHGKGGSHVALSTQPGLKPSPAPAARGPQPSGKMEAAPPPTRLTRARDARDARRAPPPLPRSPPPAVTS